MKRLLLYLLLTVFAFPLFAQSQLGYVKTLGRPNKPGQPLKGVTVRIRNVINSVVSDNNGRFSVVVPDKKDGDALILQQVRLNGFELCDRDMIGRQLVFSTKVPIVIVMINSEELAADRKRIEDNAYRVAEKNYQKRLNDLKQQQQEAKISLEKYQQQLIALEEQYEKYQSLIGDMADRYARTDYDQLDSIDIEINQCIENGDLDKADSLIHTIFDPSTVLERNRAAKAEIKAKMDFAQQIIDKANADRDAICRDSAYAKRVVILCDNMATEYLSQGAKEKALNCLRLSMSVRQILYGEESEEVIQIRQQIIQLQ